MKIGNTHVYFGQHPDKKLSEEQKTDAAAIQPGAGPKKIFPGLYAGSKSRRKILEKNVATAGPSQGANAKGKTKIEGPMEPRGSLSSDNRRIIPATSEEIAESIKERFAGEIKWAGETSPNMRIRALHTIVEQYDRELTGGRQKGDLILLTLDSLKLLAEKHDQAFTKMQMQSLVNKISSMAAKLEPEEGRENIRKRIVQDRKTLLREGAEFTKDIHNLGSRLRGRHVRSWSV